MLNTFSILQLRLLTPDTVLSANTVLIVSELPTKTVVYSKTGYSVSKHFYQYRCEGPVSLAEIFRDRVATADVLLAES
jgi:hypothetical protein